MQETRFRELYSLYLDGALSQAELAELDAHLIANAASCDDLTNLACLEELLTTFYGDRHASAPALLADLTTGKTAGTPPTAAGVALSPLTGFVSSALEYLQNTPIVLTVLVCVGFYGTFGLLLWAIATARPGADHAQHQAIASRTDGKRVARVTAVHHCIWAPASDDSMGVGSPLSLGDSIALVAGLVEVTFDQGARVLLEGPVRCELRSANGGFLHDGRLTEIVPERARGFSLETATLRVVDLGTEFGVEVDREGEAEVHVFKGTVAVDTPRAGPALAAVDPQVLSAGQAMRSSRSVLVATSPATSTMRFVRSLPSEAPEVPQRRVDLSRATATQSSQFENRVPKFAIDGDPQTHSHTAVQDEHPFWQIDLGGLHPITAIVLYNRSESLMGRFRDLTVTILDANGQSVWKIDGINKQNVFGGGPGDDLRGPAQMTIDVLRRRGAVAVGRFIRVERTPEPRLGLNSRNVLFIAECEVYEALSAPADISRPQPHQ